MGRTIAFLLVLVVGCTEDLRPTDGDAVPERVIAGEEIPRTFAREGDWYVSPPLETASGATRAGFLLTVADERAVPVLEARGLDAAGVAGPWVRAEHTFAEGSQRVARADLGLVASSVEMRVHSGDVDRVLDLVFSAVVPVPESLRPTETPEVAGRAEALRGELADLVNDRASWGARSTGCTSSDPDKYRMAIHHTVTPSSGDIPTRLRGIQSFHMDTRGWCDIGYHFLVSLDGQVWEGRELRFLGTHVASNNTGNIGISFIGCFHSSGCNDWTPFTPPDAMVGSAATLVGRLGGLYGIDVNATTVKGHRDHSGASTSCPGDHLHARLDEIRSGAGTPVDYAAEFVSQSFPLARDPYPLPAGTEDEGVIEMRNVGAATWKPGETFLGTTEPRDGESPIAASGWIAPNRPATVDREVPPGETGRFVFSVRAPDLPGDYPQYFNLVQEGVAWFGDPGEGGPPDDQLQVRVRSTAWDAGPAAESDAGPATPDAGGVPDRAEAHVDDGCGCSAPGSSKGPLGGLGLLLFALAGLGIGRRRVILGAWRR